MTYTPVSIARTTLRTRASALRPLASPALTGKGAILASGLPDGFPTVGMFVSSSKLGGLLRRVALCAFSKSITFECGGHVERSVVLEGRLLTAVPRRPSSVFPEASRGNGTIRDAADASPRSHSSSNDAAISPMDRMPEEASQT